MIHVFNVQGSTTGDRCYINLGVHLAFLPAAGGGTADPKRIGEADCFLRTRVAPPSKYPFGWPYHDWGWLNRRVIRELAVEYDRQARPFWQRWWSFPESFASLTPADVTGEFSTRATALHAFARIALHRGDQAMAREFAAAGLEEAGEAAIVLRRSLERILGES